MTDTNIKQLYGFYVNELTNNFLAYWLPRCVDKENGGFVNCFDNSGEHLISKDKYCWSQGRFVWIFSKLASTNAPIFTKEQRQQFLELAKQGADFLQEHCLMDEQQWICSFLLNENGEAKLPEGCNRLDMSIYADCFVVAGMAMYSLQAHDMEKYNFAKHLYFSILDRVSKNDFQTLPYPLSSELKAHGIPMILSNISKDMYLAALELDSRYAQTALDNMVRFSGDTLAHFMDGNSLIHEVISRDNSFLPQLLGQHINPGHSIEDAWFMLDSACLSGNSDWNDSICRMVLATLDAGWDEEYGGLLHFAACSGGEPTGDNSSYADEPMAKQLSGWGDKLWWVHSEALYTTLRCYFLSRDEAFLRWNEKIFAYSYATFPNSDPEIREWIQIRQRNGLPCEKVVALPVKDPYHIMRNLILIIELLYENMNKIYK